MDFKSGRHEAVLLPVEGVSRTNRTVAIETRGSLTIVDKDAMVVVQHESRNAAARNAMEADDYDGEDPAPPR